MPLFRGDSNMTYIKAYDYPTMLYLKPKTLEEVKFLFRAMEKAGHQWHMDDDIMACFEGALRDGTITMVLLNSLKGAMEYARRVIDAKGMDIHEISLAAHYEAQIAYHQRLAGVHANAGSHGLVVKHMDMVMDYLERWTELPHEIKELYSL